MTILSSMKMLMLTIVGASITICCLPVILPVCAFFYILTTCVKLLIYIKYKDNAIKATGQDVLFGMDGLKSYTVVNVAIRFVGQMDVTKLKSRVLNVVQNSIDQKGQRRYRRLTQTYCREFGYTLWKDYEDFNIDQHIIVLRLKDIVQKNLEKELDGQHGLVNSTHVQKLKQYLDTNEDIDWKFLMKIILNEIGSKNMSSKLPQWQVFFLEESNERYSMVFRFHHALADGVYLTRMLCEDFLESPADLFHNYVPPSKMKLFLAKLLSFSLIPFGLWKMVKNKDSNVLHGTKLSGKKRFYLSNLMELEKLRNIKQRTQVGAHSVMFTCLSNALASHFARRSTSVNEITTLIPVPLQNLQKPIKFKNKFSILSMKVPTPPKQDPQFKGSSSKGCSSLERLNRIKFVLEDAKRDPSFIAVHSLIVGFCSLLPLNVAELFISTKGCSVAFSNMPGPLSEIRYGNDRIEEIMFWNPDRDPMGTGISIFSYKDKFRVGLCIDEALLVDETEGDLFLEGFECEVKNLLQELEQNTFDQTENSNFLRQYS